MLALLKYSELYYLGLFSYIQVDVSWSDLEEVKEAQYLVMSIMLLMMLKNGYGLIEPE